MRELLAQSPYIDTVLLACTHYPLLLDKLKKYVAEGTTILSQGKIVADSLADYLQRHKALEEKCTKNSTVSFYTTDSVKDFNDHGAVFFGRPVSATHIEL